MSKTDLSELKPGSKKAWGYGCKCTENKDITHLGICPLWSQPPKAYTLIPGKQVNGILPGHFTGGNVMPGRSGVLSPKGLTYTATPLSSLWQGDMYVEDHLYQKFCAGTSPGWPNVINGYTLQIQILLTSVGIATMIWKVEFIY